MLRWVCDVACDIPEYEVITLSRVNIIIFVRAQSADT